MRRIPTKFTEVQIFKHEDEYIVKVPSNPNADYFTGDWQDALDTTASMEAYLRAKSVPCPNWPEIWAQSLDKTTGISYCESALKSGGKLYMVFGRFRKKCEKIAFFGDLLKK